MAVAGHIDLNTLDNLSRTCRAVHHALVQFRTMLLVSTQRCINENREVNTDDVIRYRARISTSYSVNHPQRTLDQDMDTRYQNWVKAGQCARDLVSDCRRCGRVVCRVGGCPCATELKPPATCRHCAKRICPELRYQAPDAHCPAEPTPPSVQSLRSSTARPAGET